MSDEWYTPPELVALLAADYGPFDLDPCATASSAKAPAWYTSHDDGLSRPWYGNVFLNPPYSRGQLGRWLSKAHRETPNCTVIVALVPASTDTRWWTDAERNARVIRYVTGRLRFGTADGARCAAPFGSAVMVFADHAVTGGRI